MTVSGSCRCAIIGVPCRLRMLSIFSTFENMLKLTISPQAKRAETDLPCEHGLDKKFVYAHLGAHAAVRPRESGLQGKFRQSADNGHPTN